MANDAPEIVQLETQVSAVVRAHVAVREIPTFLGTAFTQVLHTLAAQGLTSTGPPFACYTRADEGFDVEAGFPASGVVSPEGPVVASALPGGVVARVVQTGDDASVANTYEATTHWLSAEGYLLAAPPWESYLDGPEVAEPRTLVCFPLRHATQN